MAPKNTEPTVEATPDETPVESTEAPATVEETPIDISAFTGAVVTALSEADESTGTLPEASVAKVREAYQALDGVKPKNAAKAHLQDELKESLVKLDVVKSRAIMQLTEEAAVAGKSSTPAKVVDPTEQFVNGLAVLTLALYLAQGNVPEGVDKDAAVASATTRANEAFAEAQEVAASEDHKTENALISAALKVATTKARKASGPRAASDGPRRDLGAHISEAFAAADEGAFLTVAQIRKFESTGYGSDHPSAGAITNRLQPKSGNPTTIPGITVETRDGKLGAVKTTPQA